MLETLWNKFWSYLSFSVNSYIMNSNSICHLNPFFLHRIYILIPLSFYAIWKLEFWTPNMIQQLQKIKNIFSVFFLFYTWSFFLWICLDFLKIIIYTYIYYNIYCFDCRITQERFECCHRECRDWWQQIQARGLPHRGQQC